MTLRVEMINNLLRSLVTETPDIEGAAIVSSDGLIVDSVLAADIDEDRVSAMAAALLSLGERTATELARGRLEQVYVRGENGYVVLMRLGSENVLEVIVNRIGKLGMVLLDMKRAAAELVKAL